MECEDGKLFVGGILKETSEETLKHHFSQYGPLKECMIIKHLSTGQSRGFGFVKFDEPSHAHLALARRNPNIDGKFVEVKLATKMRSHTLKIFVGGLAYNLADQDFKKYFEEFGKVEEAVIMRDKETGVPRGFGFVTFDSEVAVDNVLRKKFHRLGNKRVEVKRPIPKGKGKIYNIYDAIKTGLGLGYGRDRTMVCNGSGCDLPWVYYDSEVNHYHNTGFHYYYCPCPNTSLIPIPNPSSFPSCGHAATHFHGSNTFTDRWIHVDHAKYSNRVYTNGGDDENVGNKVRDDHADYRPKGSSRNLSSTSNDNDESKEAGVLFIGGNGIDNHLTGSNELDSHFMESNELVDHNVFSRSKGKDDCNEAGVSFAESNGLNNHFKESNGFDIHNVSIRSKDNDDSKKTEVSLNGRFFSSS